MRRLADWAARRFPAGGFARNASVLVLGSASGQGLALLAAPLLTRLYTPADFGHLQVYISIMTFALLTSTWRYELAILLPRENEEAGEVLAVALCVTVLMAAVYSVLLLWASLYSSWPAEFAALQPYLWLLPLGTLGGGGYLALSHWALRQTEYVQVARTRFSQAASQIAVQLLVGSVTRGGVLGLLLGDTVGRITGSASLARSAWRKHTGLFRGISRDGMLRVAVRYRRFPLISTASSLVNTAGFTVPVLLIADFYGAQVLGWFALVSRVLAAPAALIGQAVSQVYMREAAHNLHSDPEALRRLFNATLQRLAWIGAVPCLLLMIAAPPLFAFVFGEEWRQAGHYARMLAVVEYMGFIAVPLMPTLTVLEKQHWQILWDVSRLLLTVPAVWLAFALEWPPYAAIGAYGAAMFAAYAGHLAVSYLAIARRNGANLTREP